MMRPPMPGRKMRRRGNVFLNAGGKADDDDMNKTAPFRLPNSLWTNQSDLKTPEQKCSDIYQSYATMAATRLVMAQDDGFGNECSEDVNVSETTSKILTHKEKQKHALGNEFRAKHVAKRGSNLKVGRVENYRDETSARVRKGRDGLGE